jgi:branched-chain amino acid transport system permease protein
MAFWIIQTLNGLSFSMMLFLVAAGFTLIFGLMKIINIAHGSFYLLSAYIGLTVLQATENFLLATIALPLPLSWWGSPCRVFSSADFICRNFSRCS